MNLTLVASTCNEFYASTLLAVECYMVYGHFSSVSGQKRTAYDFDCQNDLTDYL